MKKADYEAMIKAMMAELQSQMDGLGEKLFSIVCTPDEFVKLPEYMEYQELRRKYDSHADILRRFFPPEQETEEEPEELILY